MRDRVGCNKLDPELLICISNNIGRIGKHNEIDQPWRQGLDRKGIGFNFDSHLVEDIDCELLRGVVQTGGVDARIDDRERHLVTCKHHV